MLMNAISGGAHWLIIFPYSDRIEPPFGCPFDSINLSNSVARMRCPEALSKELQPVYFERCCPPFSACPLPA